MTPSISDTLSLCLLDLMAFYETAPQWYVAGMPPNLAIKYLRTKNQVYKYHSKLRKKDKLYKGA
jgi:hypothetical protein